MKKILFIIKNKNEASSRFRVGAYLPYLQQDFSYQIFYAEYNNKKIPKFLRSVWKRVLFLRLFFQINRYDVIFMQRPMSSDKKKSTMFEYLLSKLHSKIIFDFDDALFVQNETKIQSLCKLSNSVICGNDYLADFAKKHNPNTYIIPTTIDTQKYIPKTHPTTKKLTVGWTGTSGNYANFSQNLIETLQKLTQKYENLSILFICDKKPPKHFNFPYNFIQWQESSEVEDLQKIDIGLMPLEDSAWTRGKCGFKLIQYGSIGVASVGSDVGVNSQIIINNTTGYLISKESEWYNALELLIQDDSKRKDMGQEARKHIINNYDTLGNYKQLQTILHEV